MESVQKEKKEFSVGKAGEKRQVLSWE